jgi:hypothetical protein
MAKMCDAEEHINAALDEISEAIKSAPELNVSFKFVSILLHDYGSSTIRHPKIRQALEEAMHETGREGWDEWDW